MAEAPIVTEAELLSQAARAGEARVRLRAAARTPVSRDMLLRLRSAYRTHDRLGTQPYQPGDSVRLLLLRDLIARGQYTIRTYHALAEIRVRVVLDCSRSLLAHPQTGPFAIHLALALAAAGVWRQQPTSLVFLGAGGPPTPPVARFAQIGGLVQALAAVRPVPLSPGRAPRLLEEALGLRQANVNLFLVLHAGYPEDVLEALLRTAKDRASNALAFPVVAAEELRDLPGPVLDPESGARVEAPPDRAERLAFHLDRAVALGRRVGVPVEPLVVVDPITDMETLLPLLAGL